MYVSKYIFYTKRVKACSRKWTLFVNKNESLLIMDSLNPFVSKGLKTFSLLKYPILTFKFWGLN